MHTRSCGGIEAHSIVFERHVDVAQHIQIVMMGVGNGLYLGRHVPLISLMPQLCGQGIGVAEQVPVGVCRRFVLQFDLTPGDEHEVLRGPVVVGTGAQLVHRVVTPVLVHPSGVMTTGQQLTHGGFAGGLGAGEADAADRGWHMVNHVCCPRCRACPGR